MRSGHKVHASSLHGILRNPIYAGFIRFTGAVYEGAHEPLVSLELFNQTQRMFEPNRNGNKEQKHLFALRDFLYCAECGCKITAERQRGHVYYRCTHGKGRDLCHEKAYTREERLLGQVESILASIELGEDLIEALRLEAGKIDAEDDRGSEEELEALRQAIADNKTRVDRLLDSYLESDIDRDLYQHKARELGEERLGFEQRRVRLEQADGESLTARLDRVVAEAGKARLRFRGATTDQQRDVLGRVLLNATLRQQEIVEYKLKEPFVWMQTDQTGDLIHGKWALLDLNRPLMRGPDRR